MHSLSILGQYGIKLSIGVAGKLYLVPSLPKNSKTLGSLNSSEGTIVTFESTDKVMDIINFYKDALSKNGYVVSEGGESLISDKGGLINWKKDKKEVGVMLGFDKDKNITSLVITYK